MRTEEEMVQNQCKFTIRQEGGEVYETKGDEVYKKIKKVVQKRDENDELVFETKMVTKKKGCGCKNKPKTEVTVEEKVPVMEEVWVEELADPNAKQSTGEEVVVCRLYGKVKKSFCQKCSTYKKA